MKIAIVHLDLGQGGAERQTIDEAIALKANGHHITIYTSHHDRNRAFDETTDENILGNNIEVYGDWIPRHIFGKCHALLSIYRMLWCSLRVLWSNVHYDIIFIDQVAAVIPFLKLKNQKTKVIYYCHHPDLLLVQNRNKKASFLNLNKKYRVLIDWFESITTVNCDELLVNSQYTKQIVLKTFPLLKKMPFLQPKVVYPAININQFHSIYKYNHKQNKRITFLSINRYERKKQIDIAIKALNKLFITLQNEKRNEKIIQNIKLIVAGGYDERVLENKQYFSELIELCNEMKLKYQFINLQSQANDEKMEENILFLDRKYIDASVSVYFVTKFADKEKEELLKECCCVLYTPQNEHFGIVPIEAMLAMRPVIAQKSGGPLETIIHTKTGFLCQQNEDQTEWVKAMKQFVDNKGLTLKMGEYGKQRVIQNFSRKELQNVMQQIVKQVVDKKFKLSNKIKIQTWVIICIILGTFVNLMPILLVLAKIDTFFS